MTIPTATFQTQSGVGNREDLSDLIYNISPIDTPFMSNASKNKATGVYHEWQTDSLAAAATNAAVDGDDATNNTVTPTVRLGNFTQILTKVIGISGTQEAVNKAGRKSEMAYQVALKGKEIKRDLEYVLTRNQGNTAGASGSARLMASAESWIFTNRTDIGTGGANTTPGFISGRVVGPTDASATSLTVSKAHLDAMIQAAWTQGGDPKVIMGAAATKRTIAGFTGIATIYREVKGNSQAAIVGGADLYISNFGEHMIVPNRFMRTNVVLILDMDYWGVSYLREFQVDDLAKTGDSVRKQLLTECTLESKNEAASAKITTILNLV